MRASGVRARQGLPHEAARARSTWEGVTRAHAAALARSTWDGGSEGAQGLPRPSLEDVAEEAEAAARAAAIANSD